MKRFFLFLILLIQGCDTQDKNQINIFKDNVTNLLTDSDSVVVSASELTNFSWERLCFNRSELLKLSFYLTDSKIVFEFSYKEYFVDEPYVKNSLDGKCITPMDDIVIKRKYPRYSKTIEFLAVDK